jgi:hypothetical protein
MIETGNEDKTGRILHVRVDLANMNQKTRETYMKTIRDGIKNVWNGRFLVTDRGVELVVVPEKV